MYSIYRGADKNFILPRVDIYGNLITTVPQNMWFTVKETDENISFVIQKTLGNGITQNTDGEWVITINSADTAELKPGKYVCDVKVKNENGKEYPIIKPQEFVILGAVTLRSNQGG
jgi:hypothetical protein